MTREADEGCDLVLTDIIQIACQISSLTCLQSETVGTRTQRKINV